MSSVDLYGVKSGDLSTFCRFTVFFNDTVDFIFRKRSWNLSACFRWNVRSGYWLHICSLRLSGCSCMVDLDTDTGSVLMNSFCQLEQTWKIIILIDTKLDPSGESTLAFSTIIRPTPPLALCS